MAATLDNPDPRWIRTREALLAGGQRVFAAKGVEAATVSEIARAAGVSQPSFYNHFASKSELARAIARDFFEADAVVKARAFARFDDPAAGIAANICHTLGVASRDPAVAWVLVRSGEGVELLRPGGHDELAAMIGAGLEQGRFRGVEPRMAARVLRGAALPVLQDRLTGDAPPDAPRAFAAMALRLLGLARADADRVAARAAAWLDAERRAA